MNEMKVLEEFRAAVAPPDQDMLADVRARVLRGDTHRRPAQARRRGPGRRRLAARPWLVTAAVTAAAAVTTAIVIPSGSGPAPRPAVQLDVATVLHRAALAALTVPVPGANQFLFVATRMVITGGPGRPPTFDEQDWLSVNGAKRGAVISEPCQLGLGRRPVCAGFTLPPGSGVFTYASLKRLPTEPRALLGYLERSQVRNCGGLQHGLSRADQEWAAIYTVLYDVQVLPPRFGAALFEAAALIPGVTVIRHVTDAAGRPGIALKHQLARGEPVEFIFDPASYRFTGSAQFLGRNALSTAVGASRFVNTAPAESVKVEGKPACTVLTFTIPKASSPAGPSRRHAVARLAG
ncbi:MAG TPA: CU044_5270 family protein [Streptosporangiaceae bacterium]